MMMSKFAMYYRFGHGHDRYLGEIEAGSGAKALKIMASQFPDIRKDDRLTEFYVDNRHILGNKGEVVGLKR